MNPRVKEKWLEALRSGRYEQGKGALNFQGKFCCLGVLTDIYIQETGGEWVSTEDEKPMYGLIVGPVTEGHVETGILPTKVMEWAEIECNPYVKVTAEEYKQIYPKTVYIKDEGVISLASANDMGFDFLKIAKLIESQL